MFCSALNSGSLPPTIEANSTTRFTTNARQRTWRFLVEYGHIRAIDSGVSVWRREGRGFADYVVVVAGLAGTTLVREREGAGRLTGLGCSDSAIIDKLVILPYEIHNHR